MPSSLLTLVTFSFSSSSSLPSLLLSSCDIHICFYMYPLWDEHFSKMFGMIFYWVIMFSMSYDEGTKNVAAAAAAISHSVYGIRNMTKEFCKRDAFKRNFAIIIRVAYRIVWFASSCYAVLAAFALSLFDFHTFPFFFTGEWAIPLRWFSLFVCLFVHFWTRLFNIRLNRAPSITIFSPRFEMMTRTVRRSNDMRLLWVILLALSSIA